MKKKTEIRDKFLRLRVNPTEWEKIKAIMNEGGYTSVSHFLRDLIFRKRLAARKGDSRPCGSDQIGALEYQIKKIGNNHNQMVANYNAQMKWQDRNGRPFLDTKKTGAYFVRAEREYMKILTLVSMVYKIVEDGSED